METPRWRLLWSSQTCGIWEFGNGNGGQWWDFFSVTKKWSYGGQACCMEGLHGIILEGDSSERNREKDSFGALRILMENREPQWEDWSFLCRIFLFLLRMMQGFTSLSFSGCNLAGAFSVQGGADVSCRMRGCPLRDWHVASMDCEVVDLFMLFDCWDDDLGLQLMCGWEKSRWKCWETLRVQYRLQYLVAVGGFPNNFHTT